MTNGGWTLISGDQFDGTAYSLANDGTYLYVGTEGDGMWRYNISSGAWSRMDNGLSRDDFQFWGLIHDPARKLLYAATWTGVYVCNVGAANPTWSATGGYEGEVWGLTFDSVHNLLYAATELQGVWRYDPARAAGERWQALGGSIGNREAYSLTCDVERNLIYAGISRRGVWVAKSVAMTIDSIDPAAAGTGKPVSIKGSGFGTQNAGTDFVSFGGVKATTYESWTDSEIRCRVPSMDPGAVMVSVSIVGAVSNQVGFNVLAPSVEPLVTAAFYFAEGTSRPGFAPYFTIQNAGAGVADVKITYMCGDGSNREQTLQVGAASRSTVDCKMFLGEGTTEAFDFSAKVESTNGAAIICERPMYFDYQGWTGGHAVVGATSPATAFYFAEGTCRPGFVPYITIQNPQADEAAVQITYMLGDGNTQIQNFPVAGNSRYTVPVKNFLGEGTTEAFDFSAKVETTNAVPIICERPMYFDYQGWTGGHDVVGATAAMPAFYFAEGTSRPGFVSYITIQNPGATVADVKITYMLGDGNNREQTLQVAAHARATVV